MNQKRQPTDLFSRFVNWLSAAGGEKTPINRAEGNQDFFSKIMNRISD